MTKRDETAAPLPDLVGRLFGRDRLDHTWVGDVSYVPTIDGWLYLATVLDLGSRRLLGYSMSDVAEDSLEANPDEPSTSPKARIMAVVAWY